TVDAEEAIVLRRQLGSYLANSKTHSLFIGNLSPEGRLHRERMKILRAEPVGPPSSWVRYAQLRKLRRGEVDGARFAGLQIDRLLEMHGVIFCTCDLALQNRADRRVGRVLNFGHDGEVCFVERCIREMRDHLRMAHRNCASR